MNAEEYYNSLTADELLNERCLLSSLSADGTPWDKLKRLLTFETSVTEYFVRKEYEEKLGWKNEDRTAG